MLHITHHLSWSQTEASYESSDCPYLMIKFFVEGNPATTSLSMPHSSVPLMILKYPFCHPTIYSIQIVSYSMKEINSAKENTKKIHYASSATSQTGVPASSLN